MPDGKGKINITSSPPPWTRLIDPKPDSSNDSIVLRILVSHESDSRAGRGEEVAATLEDVEEWTAYDLHFESRLLEQHRPSCEVMRHSLEGVDREANW